MGNKKGIYALERSAKLTIFGIILLFLGAISTVLIAPRYVDPSWTEPSSEYQKQMYEFLDPNVYISRSFSGGENIQNVYRLKKSYSVLKFSESKTIKILAPKNLQKYVNKEDSSNSILTTRILLLRPPLDTPLFEAKKLSKKMQGKWKEKWVRDNPNYQNEKKLIPKFEILELYESDKAEVFSVASSNGILENWIDENFSLEDKNPAVTFHNSSGVIYIKNPMEFRVAPFMRGKRQGWKTDQSGRSIKDLHELKSEAFGFLSRKELIEIGENIFAVEGCWYCHTDQTRTLVQDTVVNGSDDFPAPPSSANEYIYQNVSFPGTQRNGPDLSRVAIKRPGRDWHRAHFWSPKTESSGSIMPSYRHFFDFDPRGTSKNPYGVPNYKFEAMYQYLMTKGSRITAPNRAWWHGKDPVQTLEIIEGRKKGKQKET
ncbi:Uncharacterized protein AB751O23_AN_00070 [Chlamydiales bacterium SCGC AB-751-O23]|jgi:cytochrome c oxidase cbb3-type subunit II|nr:Uncharacterized protein AB751O23_AN_00070 [Chlamydiales bacterium SCGC AB-751-O23]